MMQPDGLQIAMLPSEICEPPVRTDLTRPIAQADVQPQGLIQVTAGRVDIVTPERQPPRFLMRIRAGRLVADLIGEVERGVQEILGCSHVTALAGEQAQGGVDAGLGACVPEIDEQPQGVLQVMLGGSQVHALRGDGAEHPVGVRFPVLVARIGVPPDGLIEVLAGSIQVVLIQGEEARAEPVARLLGKVDGYVVVGRIVVVGHQDSRCGGRIRLARERCPCSGDSGHGLDIRRPC